MKYIFMRASDNKKRCSPGPACPPDVAVPGESNTPLQGAAFPVSCGLLPAEIKEALLWIKYSV